MNQKDDRKKAHTRRRSKYAQARVSRGLKYDDLLKMGFGSATIQAADRGRLPRHPAIRASYLAALGLSEPRGGK